MGLPPWVPLDVGSKMFLIICRRMAGMLFKRSAVLGRRTAPYSGERACRRREGGFFGLVFLFLRETIVLTECPNAQETKQRQEVLRPLADLRYAVRILRLQTRF